jgi:hypothetical protein
MYFSCSLPFSSAWLCVFLADKDRLLKSDELHQHAASQPGLTPNLAPLPLFSCFRPVSSLRQQAVWCRVPGHRPRKTSLLLLCVNYTIAKVGTVLSLSCSRDRALRRIDILCLIALAAFSGSPRARLFGGTLSILWIPTHVRVDTTLT